MMLRIGLERLRHSLANSPTFQTMTGTVGHPEQADKHIYDHWLAHRPLRYGKYSLEELQAYRPYAMITNMQDGPTAVRQANPGEPCSFAVGGTVMATFVKDVPEDAEDDEQIAIDFETQIDAILRECLEKSGTAKYLDIFRATGTGPERTKPEEISKWGDALHYELTFAWGQVEA